MADYTILIIDYEPRSIERLCKPLELAGYAVEVAKDGKAGILKFHEIEPAAVIIEAMLPKRHGFEVCQELKQTPHGNRCPIMIATSVYRGRRYRHQAMHLLCIAGLGGLAQISLPLAEIDGLPLGLSLVGARGADLQLLALARKLVSPGFDSGRD